MPPIGCVCRRWPPGGLGRTPEAGRRAGWFCHSPRNVRAGSVTGRRDLDDLGVTNPAVGCNLRSLPAGQVRGQILPASRWALCGFPGPYQCPAGCEYAGAAN
jgi:hypothetical protein